MELKKFIKDFEAAVDDVKPGTLNAETVFRDLKSWDSLAVLTVTDMIDLEYGVLLSKSQIQAVQTIEELYACVVAKHSA